MNPWDILGWLLVGIVSGFLLGFLAFFFIYKAWGPVRSAARYLRHLKTRNTPPAKGQRWMQGDAVLRIIGIYDNGVIGIESGISSWGDSPDDWKKRIRSRRLYLLD